MFIPSKLCTDKKGKQNSYTMVCPPVREIIHSLKLVDSRTGRQTMVKHLHKSYFFSVADIQQVFLNFIDLFTLHHDT